MPTASRILGDQVGSTAPVFLAFLAVHVLAGLTAVVTGAAAAWRAKAARGTSGRAAGTTGRSPSSLAPRPSWPRCAGGRITTCSSLARSAFAAATVGYQHRRRHRPGDTGHIAGMGTAYVAMLTAFYVDNGPHLPLWDHLPALAFWLLPSAIGAPVIARAIWHAKQARSHRGPQARTLTEHASDPAQPPGR